MLTSKQFWRELSDESLEHGVPTYAKSERHIRSTNVGTFLGKATFVTETQLLSTCGGGEGERKRSTSFTPIFKSGTQNNKHPHPKNLKIVDKINQNPPRLRPCDCVPRSVAQTTPPGRFSRGIVEPYRLAIRARLGRPEGREFKDASRTFSTPLGLPQD